MTCKLCMEPFRQTIMNHCLDLSLPFVILIILSTMKKTLPDDRSCETEVINSSQIRVFTGKYLLRFYSFNNTKNLSLVPIWLRVYPPNVATLFPCKKLLVAFSLTSRKPPVQWRERWRKACMLGSKGAKPKRGDHMAPTKQHLSKIWISHSLDWSTKNPKTLPKTHKSHFIVFTNSWMWSHYSRRHEYRHWNHSRDERETQFGGTNLGWPAMWQLRAGKGGRAGGGECPTGASSQTHAQRQASKLKNRTNTTG